MFYTPVPTCYGVGVNQKPPKLRIHKQGYYFVRWGGKDHYLGKNKADAEKEYLASLQDWATWRAHRNTQRLPPIRNTTTVVEAFEQFLHFKENERGPDAREYYRKHLARFIRLYGRSRLEVVRPAHIMKLRDDMLQSGYAPKTINHDVTSIKTFVTWASVLEMMPPIPVRGIKSLPLGPPPDKSLPYKTIRKWILKEASDDVRPWLAINYLCLMRPSEVVRVVHQQGEWAEEGVFVLDKGKMDARTRQRRHVVFSNEALKWLEKCHRRWSRLDSYSAATRADSSRGGPGQLRHSAATHLHESGVGREDIDLLLGHVPSRVSLTYARIVWQPLREKVAQLTLQ